MTLYVGNDGGAYKQHVAAGQEFVNDSWGDGVNLGPHTLQPYDVAIAKDGTIVAGLQDNGEMKISPDGRQDMIFGGDGFFTTIDPDNSNRIVEEYAYGRMSESVDGGRTWIGKHPSWGNSSSMALFSAPLQLDPANADHLMAGGKQISQTAVPYTYRCYPDDTLEPTGCPLVYVDWLNVFDLGNVPGTTGARKATAVDLRGDAAYAAACGPCSVFTKVTGFESGIVTNVGGAAPPKFGASDGWHEAPAAGLPERYITSVRMDPSGPTNRTIYVTLGGYSSHWVPPVRTARTSAASAPGTSSSRTTRGRRSPTSRATCRTCPRTGCSSATAASSSARTSASSRRPISRAAHTAASATCRPFPS